MIAAHENVKKWYIVDSKPNVIQWIANWNYSISVSRDFERAFLQSLCLSSVESSSADKGQTLRAFLLSRKSLKEPYWLQAAAARDQRSRKMRRQLAIDKLFCKATAARPTALPIGSIWTVEKLICSLLNDLSQIWQEWVIHFIQLPLPE